MQTYRQTQCMQRGIDASTQEYHTWMRKRLHTRHTCIDAWASAYIQAYIHTYIHTHIQASTHTYIDTGLHTCIHAYAYVYTHTDGWTDGRMPAELAEPKVGMLFSLLAANQVHGDDLTHGLQVIE